MIFLSTNTRWLSTSFHRHQMSVKIIHISNEKLFQHCEWHLLRRFLIFSRMFLERSQLIAFWLRWFDHSLLKTRIYPVLTLFKQNAFIFQWKPFCILDINEFLCFLFDMISCSLGVNQESSLRSFRIIRTELFSFKSAKLELNTINPITKPSNIF